MRQAPEDRAMQWSDMPREARSDLSGQMRNLGMARSDAPAQRQRLHAAAANPESSDLSRLKAERRLLSQSALAPVFRDRPITHAGATQARVSLVEAGGERTRTQGTDPKHDWYFQHHRRLSNVAYATGHDKARVIAASAVMSPQNNPEQELAAVTSLASMHSNPNASITVGHEAVAHNPELADYVGRAVHPSSFTPSALASVSDTQIRGHVQTSGVDLDAMAKGGVKGNVVKAINVLRGRVHPGEAISPKTSPKVWSYHNNIAKSEYGSAEHEEFTRRMRTATGLMHHGEVEGQMDLGPMYPELKTATHGPLDPTGHTAEDTWQQAISTRQQLESVDIPGRSGRAGRQSPAKFSVGEGGSANQKMLRSPEGMTGVGQSATMHAWQNEATIRAAKRLSAASGEVIPSMGVQAGGWTEARRQAGKSIEEQTAMAKPSGYQQPEMISPSTGKVLGSARPPVGYRLPPLKKSKEIPGQMGLF